MSIVKTLEIAAIMGVAGFTVWHFMLAIADMAQSVTPVALQ